MMYISLLSWITAYIYGTVLVFWFLDIKKNIKNILFLVDFSIVCIALQIIIAFVAGFDALNKLYPILVHIPMLLFCVFFYKQKVVNSLMAIMISYMFTIPRNWFGDIVKAIFTNIANIKDIVKILVTIPLLIAIIVFLSPKVRDILKKPSKYQYIILIPSIMYYCIAYATTVYTNLLYKQNTLTVEFIVIAFSITIFVIAGFYYRQLEVTIKLEHRQKMIEYLSNETKKRIDQINDSQNEVKTLRHDLRHYFQIIDTLACENNTDEIIRYVKSIEERIDNTRVKQYCLNKSLNLILSAYADKANKNKVKVSINANIPEEIKQDELDLCVLIANAFENAVNGVENSDEPYIKLDCNIYSEKIVIIIENSCCKSVKFINGIPQTNLKGHGLGTYSIMEIVKKYGGVVDFSLINNTFCMKAVL